jgi:hypothetical protein
MNNNTSDTSPDDTDDSVDAENLDVESYPNLQNWLHESKEPKPSDEFVRYFVGCDLGQRVDYTTVAVVEQCYAGSMESRNAHYAVRNLQRFKLGTRYTAVASALSKMDQQLKAHAAAQKKLAEIFYFIDATGVGTGVCEIIESELPEADIYRVYITGGIKETVDYNEREVRLPKGQMVSALMAAFDSGILHLTKKSSLYAEMLDELQNYRIHITEDGRDHFGAKVGAHDDLVTSLALAVWAGSQGAFTPIMMW